MGDFLNKVGEYIAPQIGPATQRPIVMPSQALDAPDPERGGNVTDLIRQQNPEPYVQPGKLDRWMPLINAAAAGLSTPSAGGAGPILGNMLSGYTGTREQMMTRAGLAAKAQRDQALKLQQLQTTDELKRIQLGQSDTLKRIALGQTERRIGDYEDRTKAMENKPQTGKTPDERKGERDSTAVDRAIQRTLSVYNSRQRTGALPIGQGGAEIGPTEWFDTPEGKATLQRFAKAEGAPLDRVLTGTKEVELSNDDPNAKAGAIVSEVQNPAQLYTWLEHFDQQIAAGKPVSASEMYATLAPIIGSEQAKRAVDSFAAKHAQGSGAGATP